MKIETYGKDNFSIFINNHYIKDDIYDDKDNLIKYIKNYLLNMRRKLNLRGFYKVRVYYKKIIGVFMDINKLDDLDLVSNLDLRIIVADDDIYFETDDYFFIEKFNDKRFMNNKFYCIVDDNFGDITYFSELGRFIYGKEVINLLNNSKILW